MRKVIIGIIFGIFSTGFYGCSLEGSDDFTCDEGADETLFDNPPADTVYVKIESDDIGFTKSFSGIRLDQPSGFVEDAFENLTTYRREARPDGGKLYGLGTSIEDDSSAVVIAFNLLTGTALSETCRSTKVFKREHDWSRWHDNIAGAEVRITVPIDGELVTFTSDGDQFDTDVLNLDGARFLDGVGFYATLSGSFSAILYEVNPVDLEPRTVEVSGEFIMDMRVSR